MVVNGLKLVANGSNAEWVSPQKLLLFALVHNVLSVTCCLAALLCPLCAFERKLYIVFVLIFVIAAQYFPGRRNTVVLVEWLRRPIAILKQTGSSVFPSCEERLMPVML